MKERTVRDLSGEIWAELHTAVDARRDRGDDVLSVLDSKCVDAVVDVITAVLVRNAGKTIVQDGDQPILPLLCVYGEDRARKRRQSARRLGITLQ
jgi:hypothetical protein